MPKEIVSSVIFKENNLQVLLMKRRDFRLWTLPGGRVDPGESPEEAAVRETWEETGYKIQITRLIGTYTRPQLGDTRYLYQGEITGGLEIEEGPETLEVGWFSSTDLPNKTTIGIPDFVQAALEDHPEPIKHTQQYPFWQILLIRTLISIRDAYNRITGWSQD